MNPVGTPDLSRPVKLNEVALALTAAALALAIAEGEEEALAEADGATIGLSSTTVVVPAVSPEETTSSARIFGTPLSVGIELKPRNAKNTRMSERAALLDFLATSAAFL